ncbi:MAG TPA: VWA domain-containing protein [Acidobacteriaceae bacterium]|nr:VWA domain-containing protein [Acidobacteriaceae bacterium]
MKVQSQIVQLDVVVRNRKGDLVHGLHADDFTVTEDGSPQKIVSFDETSPTSANERDRSNIDSTADLDRRAPDAPVTIIVLDEVTAKFEDQYFARYSLDKYLSQQGEVLDQPTTLIARTIDRTMVLTDYTTSKKKIQDALNRHFVGNDWRVDNPNFNDAQLSASFASLLEVAKATEGHPGHKNLIWIGRGFPTVQWEDVQSEQVDKLKKAVSDCIELLRQARITLYVIDPEGVQAPSGTIDENGMTVLLDPFDQSVSFDSLAQTTGGASMHGRNDVDHLIGYAVSNGESFYTLSYRPSTPATVDPTKFRTIRVTLRDNALTATNREGYYPAAEQTPLAPFANPKGKLTDNTVFDLASASTGLMVFDGIPLTLSRQRTLTNELEISFPASAIGLEPSDGKLKADITLIALSFDRNGKVLAKDGRIISLHLADLPGDQPESRTVHVTTPLNSALPIARVRIVIRSNSNGKTGADNFFVIDRSTLKDRATGVKPH